MEFITVKDAPMEIIKQFEALYEEAFPPQEKKPLDLMRKLEAEGKMELLAIVEGQKFVGLAIFMIWKKTAILDYFAIDPSLRGGGFGGRAVREILKRFEGCKLILEIEEQDPQADNALERSRRKAFYLRNGLKETGLFVNVYHTDFELLTPDGELTLREYLDILLAILGEDVVRLLMEVPTASAPAETEEQNDNPSLPIL